MNSTAKMMAPVATRSSRRPEAFILSSDDALLLELGPAFGDRFRSRPIDQLEELNASGESSGWLAVVDAASRTDGRTLVARIEQQYPQAPLIVIIADGEESQWQQALARGHVCRILTRDQLDSPALDEALTAAERRLQSGSAGNTPPVATRSLPLLPIAIGAVAVVVGAVLWWVLRTPDAPSATTAGTAAAPASSAPAAAAPSAPVDTRPVFELLSAARVAFRDQDMLLPRTEGAARGDSALELYALALSQEPQNEEALDGLRRLQSVARSRLQSDLSAGRLDEAQRLVGIFKSAGFDAEATRAMDAEISAARPRVLMTQARRAIANGEMTEANALLTQLTTIGADRSAVQELRKALETRQADQQMTELAGGVRAAIAAGNLLEPAGNNARTQWLAMRQQNRTHPTVTATQRELQLALIARGRDALKAQQSETAQQYASAAAEFGAGAELADLRKQIQSDNEQKAEAAAAAARAAAAPPPAALAPAAAAQRPATPAYISVRATRPLNVEYPEQAARNQQTGYVVVEFMLNADGSATNVHVVEAQPQRVFDRSAINAVSRGRFDTQALGADKQPRVARVRLSFKPS